MIQGGDLSDQPKELKLNMVRLQSGNPLRPKRQGRKPQAPIVGPYIKKVLLWERGRERESLPSSPPLFLLLGRQQHIAHSQPVAFSLHYEEPNSPRLRLRDYPWQLSRNLLWIDTQLRYFFVGYAPSSALRQTMTKAGKGAVSHLGYKGTSLAFISGSFVYVWALVLAVQVSENIGIEYIERITK